MPKVSTFIDNGLLDKAKRIAEWRGESISSILRIALGDYLEPRMALLDAKAE